MYCLYTLITSSLDTLLYLRISDVILYSPLANHSHDDIEETLDAFLQNKHYIVPGKGNSKFAFLPRILSRAKVLKFTGDAFKKHTAS